MAEETLQEQSYRRIRQAVADATAAGQVHAQARTLPGPDQLSAARAALPSDSAATGFLAARGADATISHILDDLAPALTGQNLSGRYYGFVTGSTLPVAEVADNIVSAFDQNAAVHLPDQTIATEVEDAALEMLLGLLNLGDRRTWQGRIFTTGATASNILGLACGREHVVAEAGACKQQRGDSEKAPTASIGELGILKACMQAGVRDIQVLTSLGHSSLSKAAGVVGLGRASVKELPLSLQEPWRLSLEAVEEQLSRQRDSGVVNIIAVSAGEVNTSNFATTGLADMRRLRNLADQYGAWIHVDGAFAIFARALPKTPEFALLHEFAAGVELADSITVDGHKILNVPYDCGMFFTRRVSVLQDVFRNPNAAYLTASASPAGAVEVHSPMNIGLENSRRWRALPVYAALLSEGRDGVAEMVARMVRLAREVAGIVRASEDYELLAAPREDGSGTGFVVLFRARDEGLNDVLVQRIQESREWYVSGTKWDGRPACRIAVSSWRVNVDEDAEFIRGRLEKLAREHKEAHK